MPIRTSWLERLALFRSNLAPAVMLDYLGAQAFQAVVAAHGLGIFEALADGPLSAAEVATRIWANERGTALLLEALEAVGYVEKRASGWVVTAMAARWLPSLRGGLGFFETLVERSRDLEDSIRRGGPAIGAREWLDGRPGGWREFQEGMIAMALMVGDEVARKVKLPSTARRLLDVGGGHGLYGIKLCRRHPRLQATVFDLPQALDLARETIAAERMGDRVSVQAGDFWQDDLGRDYDAALLFNIVHGSRPDANLELLHKVAASLKQGGRVVILDQMKGRLFGATSKAVAALNGLILFNFAGGKTYAYGEIAGWLRSAGFASPRRIDLLRLPGSSLVTATKIAAT